MVKRNQFLEQLQRRREQATAAVSTTTPEKPVENMSEEELDEALTQARRDLLDAQHAELRERELARIQQPTGGEASGPRTLSDVLREAKRNTRRRRR